MIDLSQPLTWTDDTGEHAGEIIAHRFTGNAGKIVLMDTEERLFLGRVEGREFTVLVGPVTADQALEEAECSIGGLRPIGGEAKREAVLAIAIVGAACRREGA